MNYNYDAPPDSFEIAVRAERKRQNERWGEQNHPDGTGTFFTRGAADHSRRSCEAAAKAGTVTWFDILNEEVCEAFAEKDPHKLITELIQVAAVCKQWVEAIERRRK